MNVELRSINITSFTIIQPPIDRTQPGTLSMNVLPVVGIFKLANLPGFQVAMDIFGRYTSIEKSGEKQKLFLSCSALFNFAVDEYERVITELKNQEMDDLKSMMVSVSYSTIRGIIYEKSHAILPDIILPLATPANIPTQMVDSDTIDQYMAEKAQLIKSVLVEESDDQN